MKKVTKPYIFTTLLVCYEVACYLTMDAFGPALPSLSQDLRISHNAAQFTFTAWFLGGISLQLFIGPISERLGRRTVLLGGGLIFVLSTLFCSLAPNIHTLYLARFVQGAVVPTMIIAGYAAVHESLHGKDAIVTLAAMQSITILAPAVGPFLGGVLLVFVNWRWIFGILAIWAGLSLLALYHYMPDTLPIERRARTIDFMAIIKNYVGLLQNARFTGYVLSASLLISPMVAWLLGGPFLIIDKFQYTTVQYGIFQALVFGAFIIGLKLINRLMTEENVKSFINIGMLIYVVGTIFTLVVSYFFPLLIIPMVIGVMTVAVGSGMFFPVFIRHGVESSDAPMGMRMSLVSLTQMGTAAITSAIVGITYNGTTLSVALIIMLFAIIGQCIRYFSGCDY